jgi:hypothetical protein
VQRLFSSFPSGVPGVALILLRLCAAAALMCQVFLGHPVPVSPPLYILAGFLALALVTGAMLPLVCGVAAVVQVLVGGWPPPASVVISVIHAVALAGLGAGAYSVDAIRYGRRVVIFPKKH